MILHTLGGLPGLCSGSVYNPFLIGGSAQSLVIVQRYNMLLGLRSIPPDTLSKAPRCL